MQADSLPTELSGKSLISSDLLPPLDLPELTTKKDALFITGDWTAKQEVKRYLELTGKFGLRVQNEAGQRLTEFCQENSLVIANTFFQQHKRGLYTWTSPNGQY